MTFKIEKETRWKASSLKSETMYFIWADNECLGICYSEEEAKATFEVAKTNYRKSVKEIILEEEVKP